jgi:hypothetical protein
LADTIPVGAAVAGADGSVVACGRNRIFDPPGRGLSGSRLAHAEVDALAQLPATAQYRDHVLEEPLGEWPGRLSAALQSAFWLRHSDHPRAAEISAAFGEEARQVAERLLAPTDRTPHEFDQALPQVLACLE